MINLPVLVFYAFASLLVLSSAMVIISRNPVRGALFLVLAFFCEQRVVDVDGSRIFSACFDLCVCRRSHDIISIRCHDA